MAKQKEVTVNGQKFKLQSVSPSWYYDFNDECGMTGGKRQSRKYVDGMLRNCVISPAEVSSQGMDYFDAQDDLSTTEKLIKEIENFLRGRKSA